MSLQEKIDDAKKRKTELQEAIKKAQEQTNDASLEKSDIKDAAVPKFGKSKRTLEGHLAKVVSLGWSHDSKKLVSASQDGKLIVWNAQTTFKLSAIALKSRWVMCCTYGIERDIVACGGLDNTCSIYEVGKGEPIKELNFHTGYISNIKFTDKKTLITTSGDKLCALWDVELGTRTQKYEEHTGDVISLATLKSNSDVFLTGSTDASVRLWDVRSGKCTQSFSNAHKRDVNSLHFLENGNSFASGGDDKLAKLFDLRANRELMVYKTDDKEKDSVLSVSLSKSGKYLFTAYDDKEIIVWDTLKGKKIGSLAEHGAKVTKLELSPDGNALCSGSWDKTLKIWA